MYVPKGANDQVCHSCGIVLNSVVFYSQMEGCQGCTCSQEESLYSAVVLKYGVTEPEGVDETEVDFFFLAGCCKCVNT